MLLIEIWETCSIDQRHETGRLKHTPTEENVITEDEMVNLLFHYYVFVGIPPEKAIPEMTYTVSGGTLNPTHSLTH